MSYGIADIVRIKGFRDRNLFEIVSKYKEVNTKEELYYVTNNECGSEILLPASLFTLVCRADNREDLKEGD